MKKLLHKIRRKGPEPATRITNETVAEHREQILAGGRRFKYPIQYARHKLVFNAIIISVAALVVIVLAGWHQLYIVQNTSTFMYRVTKVLPVPVAVVDGQPALYSDYLMEYNGKMHLIQKTDPITLNSEDGKRRVAYEKTKALENTISSAYAVKIAKEKGISVTDEELEASLKRQRQASGTEVSSLTYDAVILDQYGWSASEYRQFVKSALLRQKVAYAVDDTAKSLSDGIADTLKDPAASMQTIVQNTTDTGGSHVTYGVSGWVKKYNYDGGLAAAASTLQKGAVSDVIKSTSGDGYYFVRLIDSNDTDVSYEYIQVSLSTFTDTIARLKADKKVTQYITLEDTTAAQ